MALILHRSLRRYDPDQVRWVGFHLSAPCGTPQRFATSKLGQIAGRCKGAPVGAGMANWWHQERLAAVQEVVRQLGPARVLDLGCGAGDLMLPLLDLPGITQVVGLDLDGGALARCRARLAAHPQGDRATVRQASLTDPYPDLVGFDCACLVEVIEHLPPTSLPALEGAVFGTLRPRAVVLTTPNAEFNDLLGVPRTRLRRPDHRFEWTRAQFRNWAQGAAARQGYAVAFRDLAGAHPDLGGASQMAVFTLA
jgi:small RNA 2'-O-methyltransferase